jgi:HSP20 family molecular chaperone IbpA
MKEQSAAQQREAVIPVKFVTADILLSRQNEIQVMIARRAYELFKSRGYVHGRDIEDWLRAESQLLYSCRHDLKESSEAVTLRAQVPGSFTAEQLKISVEPRRLIVSGERELDVTCGGKEPAHTEKRTQRIFRLEELPVDVDPSRAKATLTGDTVEIVMPKVAAANKPRGKSQAASSGR